MAWSVLAGTVVAGVGAISPAPNASHASGDIEYLIVENSGEAAVSLTTAAGFVAVTGGQANAGGVGPSANVADVDLFWRRWNGSDGTPTVADTGNHTHGVVVSVRGGIAAGTPHEAVTASNDTTVDNSGSATGGSTSVDDCFVIIAVGDALPDAAAVGIATEFSGWTNAALSSLAELVDSTTDSGNGGGLGVATGIKATAGAIGATTFTTVTNTAKAMVTLAVLPAAAPVAAVPNNRRSRMPQLLAQ